MSSQRETVYAESEGPDKTVHVRSLTRAFALRLQYHWKVQNSSMEKQVRGESVRLRNMSQLSTVEKLNMFVVIGIALGKIFFLIHKSILVCKVILSVKVL